MTANCRKCGVEFTPANSRIRRHDYLCVQCKRAYDADWRRRREAAGLPARGVASREWWDRYLAEYNARPEVRRRIAERAREYAKLPHVAPKVAAREAVRNAVRRGDLVKRPCQVCGDTRVDAHHHDYANPLDVRWLCRPHHVAEHAKAEGR